MSLSHWDKGLIMATLINACDHTRQHVSSPSSLFLMLFNHLSNLPPPKKENDIIDLMVLNNDAVVLAT